MATSKESTYSHLTRPDAIAKPEDQHYLPLDHGKGSSGASDMDRNDHRRNGADIEEYDIIDPKV